MLSDDLILAAKPGAKVRKLPDAKRLFLLLTPTGARLWRFRYTFPLNTRGSRENMISLGGPFTYSVEQGKVDLLDFRQGQAYTTFPYENYPDAFASLSMDLSPIDANDQQIILQLVRQRRCTSSCRYGVIACAHRRRVPSHTAAPTIGKPRH